MLPNLANEDQESPSSMDGGNEEHIVSENLKVMHEERRKFIEYKSDKKLRRALKFLLRREHTLDCK